jgi:hypothetical protein
VARAGRTRGGARRRDDGVGVRRPAAARVGSRQSSGASAPVPSHPGRGRPRTLAGHPRGIVLLPADRLLRGGPPLLRRARRPPDGADGHAGRARAGARRHLRARAAAPRHRGRAPRGVLLRDGTLRRLLPQQLPARPAAGRHGRARARCPRAHGALRATARYPRARRRARSRHADQAHLRRLRAAAPLLVARDGMARRRPAPAARRARACPRPRGGARAAVVRSPAHGPAHADHEPVVQAGRRGGPGRGLHAGRPLLLPARVPASVRAPRGSLLCVGALGAQAAPRQPRLPLARDGRALRNVLAHPEQKPALHTPHPAGGVIGDGVGSAGPARRVEARRDLGVRRGRRASGVDDRFRDAPASS